MTPCANCLSEPPRRTRRRLFRQQPEVYRYVSIRAVHNSLPFFAIVLVASGFPWFSVAVIFVQIFTGMFVDLHFFQALGSKVGENGGGRHGA